MSVIIEKFFKDPSSLSINPKNLKDIFGILPSAVYDVYFGLKLLATDADDSGFFKTLRINGGDPLFPGGITVVDEKFIIDFSGANDFDNLAIKSKYLISFAVQKTNSSPFIEVLFSSASNQFIENAKLLILQDKVRR